MRCEHVSHLAAELLAAESGAKYLHVPYKGTTPAVQELIGGQVALSFPTLVGVFLKSESEKWARAAKRAGIYQSQ